VFGQALAYAVTGRFDWEMAAWAHAFGVADHLFIVFANDYADRDLDAALDTHTAFSGGSRVLPDKKLAPVELRRAAWVMAAVLVGLSVACAWLTERHALVAAAGLALALLHAYSFPPLALSYRGGGEWLQGVGVGGVLPAVGFVAQAGSLSMLPWAVLLPTGLAAVAGNVLTALPDHAADSLGGKRTWPVRRGQPRARVAALAMLAAAGLLVPVVTPSASMQGAVVVAALVLGIVAVAARLSRGADAADRKRCLRFVVAAAGAGTLLQLGWAAALVLAPR
jgi:1,4-dihydroxy-2-naphthoate octaprenyltransferase